MRIVAISDTHNEHEKLALPPGDVLVCAGDWTGRGREKEVNDFLEWFEAQPFDYKVFICGNHELGKAAAMATLFCHSVAGMYYLEDTACYIHGHLFYGSPWTPAFFNWGFMTHSATERNRVWSKVPSDTDVLITHGPPFGILDRNKEGDCCGDYTLNEKVFEVKPKVHIFGHIHEARGAHEAEGIRFYNASTMSRDYTTVRPAMFLDL